MSNQSQNFYINFNDPKNLSDEGTEVPEEPVAINDEIFYEEKNADEKIEEKRDSETPEKIEEADLKDIEVSLSLEKVELIKKIIQETQDNLKRISHFLGDNVGQKDEQYDERSASDEVVLPETDIKNKEEYSDGVIRGDKGERVLEGVFDGQNMIGEDGKEYIIPPNYASKSKLVEGDILKLTIDQKGKFLFKQIGPIERTRVMGKLEQSEVDGGYCVSAGEKKWKILASPVTYFRGVIGDEVIILVPKNTPSKWGAVENIIKKL